MTDRELLELANEIGRELIAYQREHLNSCLTRSTSPGYLDSIREDLSLLRSEPLVHWN